MARYALLKNTFSGQFYYSAGMTFADVAVNALPAGWQPGAPADQILPPGLQLTPNLFAALDAPAVIVLGTPVRTMSQLVNPGLAGITQGFQSAAGSGN